jgi:hypothetical protein
LFDLRYHVASLAAVFLALIIGILVGVGISSQTDVSKSQLRLLERQLADAQQSKSDAVATADLLRRQQAAAADYIDDKSYDAVMNGRLRGKRVALVFIGPRDSDLEAATTKTLSDASGPPLARMRALELPIDPAAIRAALPPELSALSLEDIGRRLGEELVHGDETPLSDALAPVLVTDNEGGSGPAADAVVLAQTRQLVHGPTQRFVAGLYAGLAGGSVPAVGIERTEARPSRVALYKARGLSTVDSIDMTLGRVALATLLSGGQPGQYGLKSSATDGVTPPIDPLALAPPPGG